MTKPKQPVRREIVYPRIEVRIFCSDPKRAPLDAEDKPIVQPLTAEIAKGLLEWQTEEDFAAELAKQYTSAELKNIKQEFGDDFMFKDEYGNKVRCLANLNNRPFYPQNADDIKLEILRKKWKLNGETLIIDEYGNGQDLQHRLVGLILADQVWHLDQKKPKTEREWDNWKSAPTMDGIVVLGIDSSDDTVNTIGTGKPRSLYDALYRHEWFSKKPPKIRQRLAKICANATGFVWLRTSAKNASLAPRRPHSESFEFIEKHKRILDCVHFISDEGDADKLNPYLPLGISAGLLYLMGSSGSKADDYLAQGDESVLNWDHLDKAQEFFVHFCANHKDFEPLKEELEHIPEDAGRHEFAMRLGLFINAWHLWSIGKKITREKIAMELALDPNEQKLVLVDKPRLGGIDVEYDDPVGPTKDDGDPTLKRDSEGKALVDGYSKECLHGGEHEYVPDEDKPEHEYCKKCGNPKDLPKRKGK